MCACASYESAAQRCVGHKRWITHLSKLAARFIMERPVINSGAALWPSSRVGTIIGRGMLAVGFAGWAAGLTTTGGTITSAMLYC